MIPVCVIHEGFVRDGIEEVFEFSHRPGTGDLFSEVVPEDKIAEAQVVENIISDITRQSIRVLVQEGGILCPGHFHVVRIRGLQQDGE